MEISGRRRIGQNVENKKEGTVHRSNTHVIRVPEKETREMERRKSIKEMDKKAFWTEEHASLNLKSHLTLSTMNEKRYRLL